MLFEKIIMYFAFLAIIWEIYKGFNKRVIRKFLDDPLKSPYKKWEKQIARSYMVVSFFGLFTIAWKGWLFLVILSVASAFAIHVLRQYRHQLLAIRLDTFFSILTLILIILTTLNTYYYV